MECRICNSQAINEDLNGKLCDVCLYKEQLRVRKISEDEVEEMLDQVGNLLHKGQKLYNELKSILVELDTAVVLLKKGWKLYDDVTTLFGNNRKVKDDITL